MTVHCNGLSARGLGDECVKADPCEKSCVRDRNGSDLGVSALATGRTVRGGLSFSAQDKCLISSAGDRRIEFG